MLEGEPLSELDQDILVNDNGREMAIAREQIRLSLAEALFNFEDAYAGQAGELVPQVDQSALNSGGIEWRSDLGSTAAVLLRCGVLQAAGFKLAEEELAP